MTINLTPQQISWLEAFAAERGFTSVDEAAQFLIDEAIAGEELDLDDLSWAKPYLDEAETEIARGAKPISLDVFRQHLAAHMAKLRTK